MCLNCGCGAPEDRHGDDQNITAGDLRAAAKVNDQSLDETVQNMRAGLDQMSTSAQASSDSK